MNKPPHKIALSAESGRELCPNNNSSKHCAHARRLRLIPIFWALVVAFGLSLPALTQAQNGTIPTEPSSKSPKTTDNWQLQLLYTDGESFAVERAHVIRSMKKKISKKPMGGLHQIPVRIHWLDKDGVELFASNETIALGVRIPPSTDDLHHGTMPSQQSTVLRLVGPLREQNPQTIRIEILDDTFTTARDAGILRSDFTQTLPHLIRDQTVPLPSIASDTVAPPISNVISTNALPPPGPSSLVTIRNTGDDSNRLVLVIVVDGYTEPQINAGNAQQDAETNVSAFINKAPWDEIFQATNIYLVETISNEEGADYVDNSPSSGGTLRDTYYNTSFWFANIERLLYPDNTGIQRAIQAADDYVGAGVWNEIVMIVNSSKYGGGGGFLATNSTNSLSPQVSIHELGHSFAELADEYDYGGSETYTGSRPISANVDTNLTDLKWNIWVESGTPLPTPFSTDYIGVVGAFEGGSYSKFGIYRPWTTCAMRVSDEPFCPICKEAHLKSFFDIVNPVDAYTPANDQRLTITTETNFSITKIFPTGLSVQWRLNGQAISIGDAYNLAPASIITQPAVLTADVSYTSDRMRRDQPFVTVMWETSALGHALLPIFPNISPDGSLSPYEREGMLCDTPMQVYARLVGGELYVASRDAGEGSDHFIFITNDVSTNSPSPWAKSGNVAGLRYYLADENDDDFIGWFQNNTENTVWTKSVSSDGQGQMEGVINLVDAFGAIPDRLYIAACPYQNQDGGALLNDPNNNGSLDANEYCVLDLSTIDTDGDGIADIDEDQNRNGTTDTLETNVLDPDTDDDGYSDGVELAAGTNPLNPASFPSDETFNMQLTINRLATDKIRLTWNTRSGRTYQIQESADLLSWSNVSNGQLSGDGSAQSFDITLDLRPRRFFRVCESM